MRRTTRPLRELVRLHGRRPMTGCWPWSLDLCRQHDDVSETARTMLGVRLDDANKPSFCDAMSYHNSSLHARLPVNKSLQVFKGIGQYVQSMRVSKLVAAAPVGCRRRAILHNGV